MDKDRITLTRAQLDELLTDCGCYAAELALELARQLRNETPNTHTDKLLCRSVGGIISNRLMNKSN